MYRPTRRLIYDVRDARMMRRIHDAHEESEQAKDAAAAMTIKRRLVASCDQAYGIYLRAGLSSGA